MNYWCVKDRLERFNQWKSLWSFKPLNEAISELRKTFPGEIIQIKHRDKDIVVEIGKDLVAIL